MVHSGKPLARVLGVRRGFVPADALHGKILLALRIGAESPRRWPLPPRGVAHLAHRFFPRQLTAILDERLVQNSGVR